MQWFCNGYLIFNSHDTNEEQEFLKLPSIKLEFAEKSFKFDGAKVYNDLPLALKECGDWAGFRRLLDIHFDKK